MGASLEASGTFRLAGIVVTPSVTAGYVRLFDPTVSTQNRFQNAPLVAAFRTTAFLDRDYATVDAGVAGAVTKNLNFRLGYVGNYGSRTRSDEARASLTLAF